MRPNYQTVAATLLGLIAITSALGQGGPLQPPSGPAPSMKTLDQVKPGTVISSLPYDVMAPGYYYVATNLTSEGQGIRILASDVTIDLNGFTMGSIGSGSYNGVYSPGSLTNLTVRNGILRGWGGVGVEMWSVTQGTIENITIEDGQSTMIRTGPLGRVRNCTVRNFSSSGTGIAVGNNSRVEKCAVSLGRHGFVTGERSNIEDCSAENLTGTGFNLSKHTLATRCQANIIGSIAFLALDCILKECTANRATHGFNTQMETRLVNCSASSNTVAGFYLNNRSIASACSAIANNEGFVGLRSCVIEDSSAHMNTNSGIYLDGPYAVARNNDITENNTANAAAGIVCNDSYIVVDGNRLRANSQCAIRLTTGYVGTTIIRNVINNSPTPIWGPLASHNVGPIGGASTNSSPWANIVN